MKLLIVDDNPSMRQMINDFCSPFFTNIDECSNGLEAVDYYEKNQPDYVLMDIKMPVMNGIDALKKIKLNHPDAKIIMITQHKDKALELGALKNGAAYFLLKENLSDIQNILTIV